MKSAFLKKLEQYKKNEERPEVVSEMKKAFLKKLAMEKEKMERELVVKKR